MNAKQHALMKTQALCGFITEDRAVIK